MCGQRSDAGISRRLVNALLGAGLAGSVLGFAGAALAYLWPWSAAGAGSDLLVDASGPVDPAGIGPGEGVVGRCRAGKVLVVRRQGHLVGLGATCTHLGCTVTWNAASRQIECPCHGAAFDLRGQVLGGPAREPLALMEVTVEEGAIQVRPAAGG